MKEVTIEKVLEILNSNIENAQITTDKCDNDLTNMGMDSIDFIHIIVALEEAFECEIPDTKLFITEMNTVNKMLDILSEIKK